MDRTMRPSKSDEGPIVLASARAPTLCAVTASTPNPDVLRRVLLATDLSARCDRALNRAVTIAGDARAHLLILHAFEEFDDPTLAEGGRLAPSWRAPPDALQIATQRIREGLVEDVGGA